MKPRVKNLLTTLYGTFPGLAGLFLALWAALQAPEEHRLETAITAAFIAFAGGAAFAGGLWREHLRRWKTSSFGFSVGGRVRKAAGDDKFVLMADVAAPNGAPEIEEP